MENSHVGNGKETVTHKHSEAQFLNSNAGPKHRPLTPFRMFRGIMCLFIYLSSAFMVLICCAPITCMLVRLFSVHYSRKATAFLFGVWLSLWPFLFEKINKTKVVFSGDIVPKDERVLLIANHRTEVDWMYLWDLAIRKNMLGYIKYILKSSLMKLPIFGWGFHILEFISVERKWEADALKIKQMLATFKDPQDPLWLALFPEGTDYTEQKCIKSQQFASEKGLPILKNVLLPKTKGFCACIEELRSSIDAVYDLTIGYKYRCPLFMDNAFGVDPSEVHIHVRRFLPEEIPKVENDAASWLTERFRLKDQLLSNFAIQGYFPQQGCGGDFPLLHCSLKVATTLSFTFCCIYLTFTSAWFRSYIILSCACLASATYFNILAQPIYGYVKSILFGKKIA